VGADRADGAEPPPVASSGFCKQPFFMLLQPATGSGACWIWPQKLPPSRHRCAVESPITFCVVAAAAVRGQWPRAGGRRALECRRSRNSRAIPFTVGGFEKYELGRASAMHPTCCCASRIAGALLERRQLGLIVVASGQESRSMRVHIDRKQLDGNAIAFVLITLVIVIAFAY
jgi:hypothetical protein